MIFYCKGKLKYCRKDFFYIYLYSHSTFSKLIRLLIVCFCKLGHCFSEKLKKSFLRYKTTP